MGNVAEEVKFDVEETIFVGVGRNVEKNETLLSWTVQNFAEKKICVLHVHKTSPHGVSLTLTNEELSSMELTEPVLEAFQKLERQKLNKLLNTYLIFLARAGVRGNKVCIEMCNVEEGIIEIIARHSIKWLVMGSEAEEYHSERAAGLKSKKAFFVCQQAPMYCHIWFVCKDRLIHTRSQGIDRFEMKVSTPLLLLDSDIEIQGSRHLRSETHDLRYLDAGKYENGLNGKESMFLQSSWFNNKEVGTSKSILLLKDEKEEDEEGTSASEIHGIHALSVKSLEWKYFEEEEKLPGEEDDATNARSKANVLESLSAKVMSHRKTMEEILEGEKQEVERTKNECEKCMKELCIVQGQKSQLENQITEYQSSVEELEEKIITAVKLLVSFKDRRDKVKIEHDNAVRELKQLKNLAKREAPTFCRAEMPAFSFMEINDATHNFDPSWKISEGRCGSVYKGLFRNMDVAIRMLPCYGQQSQLEFQNKVEFLSRIRHPNLVTVIGACPESRSVVYEHLRNGSLEDRLACKNSRPPFPWQIRTRIATEICSVLIFLHSNKPCVVHGNLKPSKILFDSNFVSKVEGLGLLHLIPQNIPKETSAYVDPECIETRSYSPESDVYSFGILLLQLLTGRPALKILKDVKCAVENENIDAVLDFSAGDWPLDLAQQMALVAIRCCERDKANRHDLIIGVLEPMKEIASESFLGSKKHSKVPSHFVCPIFQEVMTDPLIAADGFTYEAEAIREWLKNGRNISPMTNLKLEHSDLVPNYALLNAIQEWQQHF